MIGIRQLTKKETEELENIPLYPTGESIPVDCKVSGRDCWNKCVYCGKFIAYDDFVDGKAENIMTQPESLVTNETWEAYHLKCKSR